MHCVPSNVRKAIVFFTKSLECDFAIYSPSLGVILSRDSTALPKYISEAYIDDGHITLSIITEAKKYVDRELFFEAGLRWLITDCDAAFCGMCRLSVPRYTSRACSTCGNPREKFMNGRYSYVTKVYWMLIQHTLRDLAVTICRFMLSALVHPVLRD